ncbi:hypothetical protein QTO34_014260 [Cnephaeus nilssonii]|uniref:Uncharacterized protein n=1 Tax=Cnephaeus nilssonii TaxID=3371016 RepID=A0AA40I737_CNENI|nr:hypothetical protein QTO34_014260 [Eptesicus nilssonii]
MDLGRRLQALTHAACPALRSVMDLGRQLSWSMICDGGPGQAAAGLNPRRLPWSAIGDGGPGQAAAGVNPRRLPWSAIGDGGPGQAAAGLNPRRLPRSAIGDGGPGQAAAGVNPRRLPRSAIGDGGPGQAAAGVNPRRLPRSAIGDGGPGQAAAGVNPRRLPRSAIGDGGPGQAAAGVNPRRLPRSAIGDGGPGQAAAGVNPRRLPRSAIGDGGPGQAAAGVNPRRLPRSAIGDGGPGQAAAGLNPRRLPRSAIGDGGPGQAAAGLNPRRLPWSTIMAWISLTWVLPFPPAIFAGLTCIFAPGWPVGVADEKTEAPRCEVYCSKYHSLEVEELAFKARFSRVSHKRWNADNSQQIAQGQAQTVCDIGWYQSPSKEAQNQYIQWLVPDNNRADSNKLHKQHIIRRSQQAQDPAELNLASCDQHLHSILHTNWLFSSQEVVLTAYNHSSKDQAIGESHGQGGEEATSSIMLSRSIHTVSKVADMASMNQEITKAKEKPPFD